MGSAALCNHNSFFVYSQDHELWNHEPKFQDSAFRHVCRAGGERFRLAEDRGEETGGPVNHASWIFWLRLKRRICLVWEASCLQGLQLLQPGEMAFIGMEDLVTQAYGRDGWGKGNSLIGSNRVAAGSTWTHTHKQVWIMAFLRWREFKSHPSNALVFHMRKLRSRKVNWLA